MTTDDDSVALMKELVREVKSLREVVSQMDHAGLLTAKETADLLGTSLNWVYEHSAELGAYRLPSSGKRSHIRFRMNSVMTALRGARADDDPTQVKRVAASDLLPVRGAKPYQGRKEGL